MKDKYLILRYFAMKFYYQQIKQGNNVEFVTISDYLSATMKKINAMEDSQIDDMREDFIRTYDRAKSVFGTMAFKLDEKLPINMILFDVTLIIVAELKKSIDIPVVYTAHGIFGNIEREYVIDTVDRIICVSNFVKQRAIKQNFSENKLLTRYCGVDVERFKPDMSKRIELRRRDGIEESTLVLATVSRIKDLEHKGHGALLEMFEKYASDKDWKLIVVGKGSGLIQFKYKISAICYY